MRNYRITGTSCGQTDRQTDMFLFGVLYKESGRFDMAPRGV